MPFLSGRRAFLRTAAGASLALPFLPSLLPRGAQAGLSDPVRRLIVLQSMSGQFVTDCWPTSTPEGYQLRDQKYDESRADGTTALRDDQIIAGTTDFRRAPLSDFAGGDLTRIYGTDLAPFYDRMSLVRGVDYMAGIGHNNGGILGNYKASTSAAEIPTYMPSIDQVLAASQKFYASPPIERMIHLSTGWNDSMSYADESGEAVNARSNPLDLWQNLFADFMPPDDGPHPNLALVHSVHSDYAALKQHRRLSAADKEALEHHMALLDDIERRLTETVDCERPEQPADIFLDPQFTDVAAFEQAVDLMIRIATVALRCDLTRIITLNVTMSVSSAGSAPATSLHNSEGVSGDWHDFAHTASDDTFKHDQLNSVNRWVALNVFKRVLEELDVEETFGSTFLDNTLVYWGGELSLDHYSVGLPTLLAGSAGGRIEQGYYYDYTQLGGSYANPGLMPWGVLIPGVAHNRLLVTIMQALGLAPGDYERDGLPGYGHNVIVGNYPYNLPSDAYPIADLGAPLPGLFVG